MEFCLRITKTCKNIANLAGDPRCTSNGLEQITFILLCVHRDRTRRSNEKYTKQGNFGPAPLRKHHAGRWKIWFLATCAPTTIYIIHIAFRSIHWSFYWYHPGQINQRVTTFHKSGSSCNIQYFPSAWIDGKHNGSANFSEKTNRRRIVANPKRNTWVNIWHHTTHDQISAQMQQTTKTITDAIEFGLNKPKKYIPLKYFEQLHGKL